MLSFSRTEGDAALDVIVTYAGGKVLDVDPLEGRWRGDGLLIQRGLDGDTALCDEEMVADILVDRIGEHGGSSGIGAAAARPSRRRG